MNKFVTYVINLPEDQNAKREIVTGVRLLVEKHGGEITGESAYEEMSVLDLIEEHEDFHGYIADEARAKVEKLSA